MTLDTDSNVYITGQGMYGRVVKLPSGSNSQTVLPFEGLNYPEGVAVDSGGAVYAADRGNDRVVKLPSGSDNPTVLPFTGLNTPLDVAVDKGGNVYAADRGNDRVVKLAG